MAQQFTFEHTEEKVKKADKYFLQNQLAAFVNNNTVHHVDTQQNKIIVIFENPLLSAEAENIQFYLNDYLDLLPSDIQEIRIAQFDEDTDGVKTTTRWSPVGWVQQYFETEFCTSLLDSIHEKDANNNDIGWSTLNFWKLIDGIETKWTPANQADLDVNCIRTDLDWMPTIDYMIKGGYVAHKAKTSENVYFWTQGIVLPEEFGGAQFTFVEGGVNLYFVDEHAKVGVDGVSGTVLYYNHPQLGAGMGTNKMRTITRHPVGYRHRLQMVFEIFRGI